MFSPHISRYMQFLLNNGPSFFNFLGSNQLFILIKVPKFKSNLILHLTKVPTNSLQSSNHTTLWHISTLPDFAWVSTHGSLKRLMSRFFKTPAFRTLPKLACLISASRAWNSSYGDVSMMVLMVNCFWYCMKNYLRINVQNIHTFWKKHANLLSSITCLYFWILKINKKINFKKMGPALLNAINVPSKLTISKLLSTLTAKCWPCKNIQVTLISDDIW